MPANHSRAILPEPSVELKRLSEELEAGIRSRITDSGPVAFSEYMETALYEPRLGYYSAGLSKFGAGGDFVTAPELGSVFAQCLARQIEQIGQSLGDYHLLEVGAGSGRLAVDLLTAIEDNLLPGRYLILERSADLRKLQQQTIKAAHPQLVERVEWLDEPPVDRWQGVVIANEVIDALPVERFRMSSGTVQQARVGLSHGKLAWAYEKAPERLVRAVEHLLDDDSVSLPDRYQSEISLLLGPWLEGLVVKLNKGCVLLADYGHPRQDYYAPERTDGTLICHYRQLAHNDPFWYPGLQDISAFVDFTAVAEAGDACGLDCSAYTSQAMFLLGCGLKEILQEMEQLPDKERLMLAAQVKQLTLPAEMGEKFQVMALSRDLDLELRGFELLDLRYRL